MKLSKVLSTAIVLNCSLSTLANDCMLDEGTLLKAEQGITEAQSWDCGPRAISVALSMLDAKLDNIPDFIENTPRTIGYPQCEDMISLTEAVIEQIPFAGIFLDSINVGPYAKCLVSYANEAQDRFVLTHSVSTNFDETLSLIKQELSAGKPVIVKIANGLFLHYQLIVGVNEDAEEVTVMHSEDGSVEVWNFEKLKEASNISSYHLQLIKQIARNRMLGSVQFILKKQIVSEILAGYNLIRFSPK